MRSLLTAGGSPERPTRVTPGTSSLGRDPSPFSRQPALLAVVLVGIVPPLLIFFAEPPPSFATRALAAALWLSCFFPTWAYALKPRRTQPPLPFLPIIGTLYALYYARPFLFDSLGQHWRIHVDAQIDYDAPIQLALIGWLLLLCGYWITGVILRQRKAAHNDLYDVSVLKGVLLAAALATSTLGLIEQQLTVPPIAASIFRVAASLRLFSFGALAYLMVRGNMSLFAKAVFVCLVALLVQSQLASGFVSPLMITTAALFAGVWLAKGKLTAGMTIILAGSIMITLFVKGALHDYRQVAWRTGAELSVSQQATLVAATTREAIATKGFVGAMSSGSGSLAMRSANMELFADIVRRTPRPVPYWNGGSYVSLIGLAIPRFMWPTKPTKDLGQTFGHRYNLLDAHDTHTSFNLPILVEFYANFGELGVALGMLLVGVLYRIVESLVNRPGQDFLSSMGGVVILLPLFNIESDFSLTFGGLLLNGLAIWYSLKFVRRVVLKRTTSLASRDRRGGVWAPQSLAVAGLAPPDKRLP